MGHILRELGFAWKLRRSAEKGEPAILIVRADKTLDITFPQKVRGNIIYYVDPRTRRQEIVILRPEAILHLGRAIIIPHIQGYLESIGWREIGSLFFAQENTVRHLRARLVELIELNKDIIPEKIYNEYKSKLPNADIITLADIWRELRAAGIINNIPPPEPPAFLAIPSKLLETLEDLRTAVLAESMAYVKQITGLQGLLGGRFGWWLLLLLIGGGLLLLLLFGGAFHPAAAGPHPIKT